MANRTFNERVVPQLQPDRSLPGATSDPSEHFAGAMLPRRDDPEDTGFSPGTRTATGPAPGEQRDNRHPR